MTLLRRFVACTRPSSVGALLALSIAVLVATAVYLVARQRDEVYATASRSLVDVSVAMESAIGAVLEQSAASLRGLAEELPIDRLDATPAEAALATLRTATRYDPASAFLGVRTATGVWIVGRDGATPGIARREAITRALPPPDGAGLRLSALVQLPGDTTWYLPLSLPAAGSGAGPGQYFALVPARILLQSSDSLRLLEQSFVTLAGTDGQRLLRYWQDSDELKPNGPALSAHSLQTILQQQRGSFTAVSPFDGQEKVFGFAASPRMPLLVSVAVPTASLDRRWVAASTPPVIVLLLGIGALAVFGLRLVAAVGARRRQLLKETYLATHDSLTGLLNRDAFVRRLGALIENGEGEPLLVVVMDLNHFKDINETLGHAAGDELLQILASRLEQLLQGRNATLARLGGDELALCLALGELHAPLEEFCAGLQHRIGHHVVVAGVGLEVTASMGAVTYPADGRNAAELLRCADIAMYAAKDEMKAFVRYEATLDHFTPEALSLKAEFTQALRDGMLNLVYQPKVSLATGALVGVEALCRWTHPTRGPIPPVRFMPLVESTELIHPFTAQVLERALQQAARWLAAGHRVPVAVNISVNNLLDPQFANKLVSVLSECGVPPELLELEVTESAVMRQPVVVQRRLSAIHDLGVKLSIDDFGTGYASLAYLKSLPVDALKIDRVFVSQLDADEADRRIVKSSIQLAHGFDMTVVAEGVESEAAATLLRQFGCDLAQGFHFARPLSAAEIEACWLGRAHALPLLS